MPDSALFAHLGGAIDRDGYATVQDFLPGEAIAALARECRELHAQSRLRPAAIGRGASRRADAVLRGDCTHWLDATAPGAAQAAYFARMDALRRAFNRTLLLGIDELEAHYALYAPGTTSVKLAASP